MFILIFLFEHIVFPLFSFFPGPCFSKKKNYFEDLVFPLVFLFPGPCFPIPPILRTLFSFSRALFPHFFPSEGLVFLIFRGWCSMLRGVVCCGHFLSANAPRNRLLLQYTHLTVTIHTPNYVTFYWAETKVKSSQQNPGLVLPSRPGNSIVQKISLALFHLISIIWGSTAMQGNVYNIPGGDYHRFVFWKLPNIWNVRNLLYSTSQQ